MQRHVGWQGKYQGCVDLGKIGVSQPREHVPSRGWWFYRRPPPALVRSGSSLKNPFLPVAPTCDRLGAGQRGRHPFTGGLANFDPSRRSTWVPFGTIRKGVTWHVSSVPGPDPNQYGLSCGNAFQEFAYRLVRTFSRPVRHFSAASALPDRRGRACRKPGR